MKKRDDREDQYTASCKRMKLGAHAVEEVEEEEAEVEEEEDDTDEADDENERER